MSTFIYSSGYQTSYSKFNTAFTSTMSQLRLKFVSLTLKVETPLTSFVLNYKPSVHKNYNFYYHMCICTIPAAGLQYEKKSSLF